MATFARATFNTASYASFRPTYPRQLFDYVFKHHERSKLARWNTAVDLGCGTGQATAELTPFKRVIGVDPSANMIESAREMTLANAQSTNSVNVNQFEYVQSSAENLPFLEDGSVDLVVSAQAAHWFDYQKLWPETARILRKGGTAAFWIYSEFRMTSHPSLNPLITAYAQGKDPVTSLGPHWQQPGRSILDNHLLDVPDARDFSPGNFSEFQRVFFTGNHYPNLPHPLPIIMRKKLSWDELYQYLQTWSSLHTFRERYPGTGDISRKLWEDLRNGMEREGEGGKGEVQIEFPLAILLARRA